MAKNTPREVLDALTRDAADQQAALGKLPTPTEIAAEFVPILEGLDKKNAEAASRPAPSMRQPDAQDIADEFKRIRGEDANIRVERKPDSEIVKPLNRNRSIEAMRDRMRLLRLQPKYQQQIKEIAGCVMDKRNPQRRADALKKAVRLLLDSQAAFGPIVKPEKAPTLYSIGGSK